MRCLVTGCAGFIASHLCARLLADGHEVVGVDAFTDYYPREVKDRNVAPLLLSPRFRLHDADLLVIALPLLVDDADVVFHLAGQPGVRASWGDEFDVYLRHNVLVTQRLLEACRGAKRLRRFVYASSSSIYGNTRALPITEETVPQPVSPYGVTKLAGEHLCALYHTNFNVPTVALRYFTVYGARQRPDMAFHRFIRAALDGRPITVHEDGRQTRDFTHVGDIVQANILAAERPQAIGQTYNIAGGTRVTLNHALALIAEVSGHALDTRYAPKQAGDVRDTYADITRAQNDLGYVPLMSLRDGLRDEVTWLGGAIGAAPTLTTALP